MLAAIGADILDNATDMARYQQDLANATTPRARRTATDNLRAAQARGAQLQLDYDNREFAINGAATVVDHIGSTGLPIGLAGGMNDAQAAEFIRQAEQQFGRPLLSELAAGAYRMNAFRVATDLASGRTAPRLAAAFSPETAALRTEMDLIATLARDPRATQQAKEAARDDFVQKLSATSKYVPTTGDPSNPGDADVLGQGFRAPNVARDRRLEGRGSLADDGVSATLGAMQKSASAAGWDDFTAAVEQAYNSMTGDQRRAANFQRVELTVLQRLGDDLVIRGDYGYSLGDGTELAALRRENMDARSKLATAIEVPTRFFARAVTQWNPTFGPINMARDLWERSTFLRTRPLVDANGRPVNADEVARRMLSMAPSVFNGLARSTWRDGARNEYHALMLREFEAYGGAGAKFSNVVARDRAQLVADINAGRSTPRRLVRGLGTWVSNWNAMFDGVSSLSAYIALREAGLSKETAASQALDLMNFRKQGAAMPIVRMFYAFAQPAVTGGVNIMRALRTPRGRSLAVAHVVAFMALQSLLASLMGDDEELGKNKLDLLDEYTKDRFMPLPLPGTDVILKLPVGFGLPMLANVIAGQARGVISGDATVGEAIGSTITRGVLPSFSPLEDPKVQFSDEPYRWFAQFLAPTVMKGGVNIAINRGGLGNEIVKEAFIKGDQFKSEQAGPTIAPFYKEIAKDLRTYLHMDMAPEQVREFIRSTMALGPLRYGLEYAVERPNQEAMGREVGVTPLAKAFITEGNPHAALGEMGRFENLARDLVRQKSMYEKARKADPGAEEPDFTEGERQILALWERWTEVEKGFRNQASAMSRAGVDKAATNAERINLREQRDAAAKGFIRQFNEIER
jgi:hypothetical protein